MATYRIEHRDPECAGTNMAGIEANSEEEAIEKFVTDNIDTDWITRIEIVSVRRLSDPASVGEKQPAVEFQRPYIHEAPYEEDEYDDGNDGAETRQYLAFDTPDALKGYDRWAVDKICPGEIAWEIDYQLEKVLRKWAIAALNLPLTAAGNLKRADKAHLDMCFHRLERTIIRDVQQWLENESHYQEIVRDRVNEAIRDLLKYPRAKERQ